MLPIPGNDSVIVFKKEKINRILISDQYMQKRLCLYAEPVAVICLECESVYISPLCFTFFLALEVRATSPFRYMITRPISTRIVEDLMMMGIMVL